MTPLSIDALSAQVLGRSEPRADRPWSAASIWGEIHRELRRHAGDERLPFDLRTRLRTGAQRALDRSQRSDAAPRLPRTRLRALEGLRLTAEERQQVRAAVERLGVRPGQPFVAADVRGRDAAFHDAVGLLESRGYAVVRLGQSSTPDAHLLVGCAFLLCDSAEAQRAAYVTDTPTIAANATDAFASYPIRRHGIYLLKTAIDLDTGRTLSVRELLGEAYYRNLRNIGYRDNTSAQIQDAVSEMLDGLTSGWRETDSQARYRAEVVAAGELLAPRVRQVATWGPDRGFIGDGTLARVQAESAA